MISASALSEISSKNTEYYKISISIQISWKMMAINNADCEQELSKQPLRQSMQSLRLNAANKKGNDHEFNGFC